MQRIIITEVDNTSNVESLSSYDVVYVPGFATNGASPSYENGATLFRTPTLVTSKYEFLEKFGSTCPAFPADQPYPIATASKVGFPSYAIPGYVPIEYVAVSGINNMTYTHSDDPTTDKESAIAAVVGDGSIYTHVDTSDTGEPVVHWAPEEDKIYYLATGTTPSGSTTTTITMSYLPHNLGEGEYASLLVFTSDIVPVENGWTVQSGPDQYSYVDDSYIDFVYNGSTPGAVKDYYESSTSAPALMFKGPTSTTSGDPDPGWRYALYLLSLGIPVYYEQMNATFEPVDMNNPDNVSANPAARDWFIQINNDYFRTTDTSVQSGVTYYKGADISIESMYKGLEARFDVSEDNPNFYDYSFDSMGDYSIKYITSGGYPTFEYGVLDSSGYGTSSLAQSMIKVAETRQDSVALVDHTNNPNRSIYTTDEYSVIYRVRKEFGSLNTEVGSYGAMFTPWYTCTNSAITGGTANNYGVDSATTVSEISQMPGSLAFLSSLAQQLRNYNPWLAVSGVSRGQVPYIGGLHTNYKLTNNVADSYQIIPGDVESLVSESVSINPITYIRNYGYCIWGNRTLRNNASGTKATSFLNIRDTVSDIKKRLYEASQQLLFEQNTDVLWLNFKNLVTPLLDTMVSNYILSEYNIVKYNIDPESGKPVPSYKILSGIRIVPINSVEVFELKIQLENSEVTVAEIE